MAYREVKRVSTQALWSRRLALFSLQLLILTVILHRFGSLHTPSAINLLAAGLLGTAIALILAIWGGVQIWRRGISGLGSAVAGLFLVLAIFAFPAWNLPKLFLLPTLNDVTTDTRSPPIFEKIAETRDQSANSIIYPGDEFAEEQLLAYPDIQPFVLERPTKVVFELVEDAVRNLDWHVVSKRAPGSDGSPGRIEAEDRTFLLGFTDDIVIRVAGDDSQSRIDVRSASRYGEHDLGRNAGRIRDLFAEIQTSISKAEQVANLRRAARAKSKKKSTPAKPAPDKKPRRVRSKTRDERARRERQRALRIREFRNRVFPELGE